MKRVLFYGYFTSYLLQVAGPIFIDPLLTTHVRYGARSYPYEVLTMPILATLTITEYFLLKWAKRTLDLYWSLIPFAVAYMLSLPLFFPEFPHANLSFNFGSCFLLSIIAIAVRHHLEVLCLERQALTSDDRRTVEYLKEAISFSRQVMVALLAGYAGFVIAYYSRMLAVNQTVVTDPGQRFLMSINTSFQFGWMTVYVLVGPVHGAFQSTTQLLEQLKSVAGLAAKHGLRRRKS